MKRRLLYIITLFQSLLFAGWVTAQDETSGAVPKLDWSNIKGYVHTHEKPPNWSRYTDSESKVSWSAPSKPKKFVNPGEEYSVTYESRDGKLALQLTINKTQTMHEGSPVLFLDAVDDAFFRSLQKANIRFEAKPIANLKIGTMKGRMMGIKTDQKRIAKVDLVTDSISCSFLALGPEDLVMSNIMPFVKSVTVNGSITGGTESGPSSMPSDTPAVPNIAQNRSPARPNLPRLGGPNFPPPRSMPTRQRPNAPSRLAKVNWHAQTKGPFPTSRAVGELIRISFNNSYETPVKLEWIDRTGKRKSYGTIDTGKSKKINTYSGTIWLVSDNSGLPLGYFAIGPKSEIAVVPAKAK